VVTNLPRHMPALDGLRGIAILMVIPTHTWTGRVGALSIYEASGALPNSFILPYWMDKIGSSAVHGVTLFFVVSAFTLTVRFAGDHEANIRHYALRRVARIGPAYWLAAICYAAALGLGPRYGAPDGMDVHDVAIAAMFGSAWLDSAAGAVVPGGWSISCEVAFYVALPVILWVTRYRLWHTLALTGILAVTAQVLARHEIVAYSHPAMQAPVFLCGIATAITAMRFRFSRHDGVAILFFVAAFAAVPFSPIANWYIQGHFQFAGLAAIGVALAAQHPPGFLTFRLIRRIGELSYSMYLLQFAILWPSLYVSELLLPGDRWQTLMCHFVLTTGVTFACACITHRFIEQPAIRWTASYLRSQSTYQPAPAAYMHHRHWSDPQ
jgi:peptidoglycan/LPS O-acetylase OafA/YrhL